LSDTGRTRSFTPLACKKEKVLDERVGGKVSGQRRKKRGEK